MRFGGFKNLEKIYVVTLFVQPDDLARLTPDLEELGSQRNVHLVVQPCPFEGIEFLYRVAHELLKHRTSMDKDLFWQAIELKETTPKAVIKKVSAHQHLYLCAILEQDPKKVEKEGKALQSFSEYYF